MRQSIEDAEKEAANILLPKLKDHLELTREFMNLIGESGVSLPIDKCTQSFKVTSVLLIRLANDLRCLGLLAERGYPFQVWTIASSIYEVGITMALLSGDDALAQKWIDYDKPDQPFFNVREATKEALSKCRVEDYEKQAEADYRVYQWLCMGKHANPLLQKEHGVIEQGKNVSLQNGPDTSETAIGMLWWGMDYASRYTYVALAAFARSHLRPIGVDLHNRIAERANTLAAKREQLRITAKQRFGGQDPFQGKWKSQRVTSSP